MRSVEVHKDSIEQLCKEHNVAKLYIFGSAATDSLTENSDVDVLVRFKQIDLSKYFINYSDLKEKLQRLFNRQVDLIEEQTLSNPYLIKSIDRTKQLIYG